MWLGWLNPKRFLSSVSIETWMACVVLVPAPLWFLIRVALDSGPAWRAEYFPSTTFSGPSSVVSERHLERYWDSERAATPGGHDARNSSARFDTCLELDAALDVPVLLVANGAARFSLDSQLELSGESDGARWVRSKVLHLPAGAHRLSVELAARGWPSIGLLASFDGRAPVAVGSGKLGGGIRTLLPAAGSHDCAPVR